MSSTTHLTASDLNRSICTFAGLLRAQKEVINRLNVYPVPDGDTGTNMSLTMESVVEGLRALPATATMGEVSKVIAHSSLLGARGNSGVILSQMLRGFVQQFPVDGDVPVQRFIESLAVADARAREAVSNPVEGTILSVARAAAEGAVGAATLDAAVHGAREAARRALAFTPEQLPVLKNAGVVDSGGTGYLLWLDALCHVVAGDELPETPELPDIDVTVVAPASSSIADLRYEVMFLLEGNDDAMPAFRAAWEAIGDSIVIVGDSGFYNCHIHTDHVGPAIEAALDMGRPRDIRVTNLLDQVAEEQWVRDGVASAFDGTTAVVAVAAGPGLVALLTSMGVHTIVTGGQGMNPSTAELAAAVRATGASNVVILPNNKNIRLVAEQVQSFVDVTVCVVATNSVMQGLSAMMGYNPSETASVNAAAMGERLTAIRDGEVTMAVRSSQSDAGLVNEGDWIGLTRDGIVTVAATAVDAVLGLCATLMDANAEICTMVTGDGVHPDDVTTLVARLEETYPNIEFEVHDGGQPLYPYLLSVE